MSSTLREKSTWTPKTYRPNNEKVFQERMALIKKWFAAWDGSQRWALVEYLLQHLRDPELIAIHDLLHPLMPPAPADFTRLLPRHVCLKIFSYLDPKSLCRAAQVCWYWKYLSEARELWKPKCLRRGWFIPRPPPVEVTAASLWKRHYISCVSQLYWRPPTSPPSPSLPPSETALIEREPSSFSDTSLSPTEHRRPWRDPDRHPEDIQQHTVYMASQEPVKDYAFMKIPTKHSMRAKRRRTHPLTPSPQQQSASRWPPTSPPPRTTTGQSGPLQPTLHPTLLEKLRLGSPSEHHMQWSAINRSSDGVAASRQLHELQSSAPFPKLPPYYCHSLLGDSEDSELVELDKEGKGLGEQETQIHKGAIESKSDMPQGVQLSTHPWQIPDSYSDDSG